MTCPDDDTLAAIATLPERERAAIADHAASCETCRVLVQDLLDVKTPSFAEAETLASGERPPAPDMPSVIDRYRIERRIGAGAMGVVYAGHDPDLARPVAVKVLRSGGSPDRMKREAQTLARLTHPNVVAVYDVGDHQGATFVTMALVDGENLRTWLETPRSTQQIIDAIVQAARGVEAAHRAGIVHRDLKPDNIFVARGGEVLVGDFGLARSGGEPRVTADRRGAVGELTQTGSLVGTPAYMAPEQVDGEASAASDQFALCVTAWEALYGSRPFTGKSIGELVAAVRAGVPREPGARKVPAHVRAAIRKGLAADPADRHASLADFIRALQPRRAKWPFVAGAAVVAAGGVAFFALRVRDDAAAACGDIAAPAAWKVPAAPKPDLAATLTRVRDRYIEGWTREVRGACKAAAEDKLSAPVYEGTRRCLDRRAAAFVWVGQQDVTPWELLGLVEGLEPVESCAGTEATKPSEPLIALQRDIDRAAVFVQHAPDLATGLGDLVKRATDLAEPAAIAEATYVLALAQSSYGRDPEAQLRAAIAAAERARDDRIRTRASALLAIVAARSNRLKESASHRDLAVSAVARVADSVTAIAVERANVALAFARQEWKAEIEALRRIEAIHVARFGELSRSLVDTRFSIASALHRASDSGAAKALEIAIASRQKLIDETLDVKLDTEALAKRSPADRIGLRERHIEMMRGRPGVNMPELLKELGYDYELIGANDKALRITLEALAMPIEDPVMHAEIVENAANYSFELADATDDKALRDRYIADALAYLDKLPTEVQELDGVQTLRGRTLLLAGRYLEAIPLLNAGLAAAERAEKQFPYRILMRSFALAQALWEVGGVRDRDRARALADEAARRIPEVRAIYADEAYGTRLDKLEKVAARIEAWRRAHR